MTKPGSLPILNPAPLPAGGTAHHGKPYAESEHHRFLEASREALSDPQLQAGLGRLSETLGQRNRDAWSQFADSSAARDRARQLKDEVLAHLDEHLETLEKAVAARGGNVHFAADAEDARRIIAGIVQGAGAKVVVKSKSMTTEEIHLNPALEALGCEVVETDLGEYLIQLAGHRPSHLVAPAMHMRLPEITEVLSRDAGRPLPPDPETLTQYARQRLRGRFAAAQVGISGANFVVAETGSVVLVTNEGNGRLTTTLPKVHIAVAGIEKVVPKFADLPVFLKVLARAATGQKLSIYTSIITGPRRADEIEGPEEFHLVLLDNGRTKILEGPLRESLFCIRCGACLNACPIYRHVGGHAYGGVYAGPIGAVLTPLYDGLADHPHLPHASSLCGACQAACPVKIAIPSLLIRLREKMHKIVPSAETGASGGRIEEGIYTVWSWMMRSPFLYRWGTWFASRLFGRGPSPDGASPAWWRRLPGPLHGWTRSRDFPPPSRERFRDWWRAEGFSLGESAAEKPEKK